MAVVATRSVSGQPIGDRTMISIRILRYIGVLGMGARYGVVRDVLQLRTVASARSPEAC